MLIEDCGGIGTFHESASIAASKLHRKVVGVSVSEYNTHLHAWLSSQFGVVDSWAGHCTWKRYKFRPYEVDIYGAGFPCQPFSRLGTMLGTKDPRFDFVVEQIHAVFGELKPKSALLENNVNVSPTNGFPQVNVLIGLCCSLFVAGVSPRHHVASSRHGIAAREFWES